MTMSSLNWEHLGDEIALLRLCLLREVRRLRQESGRKQVDSIQGLVLSDQEILFILADKPGGALEDSDPEIERQIEGLEKRCAARTQSTKPSPALQQLSELFELDRIEQKCLILCLAPEIEPKYARV